MSDVVRPPFEANPHDLKSREGARGVSKEELCTPTSNILTDDMGLLTLSLHNSECSAFCGSEKPKGDHVLIMIMLWSPFSHARKKKGTITLTWVHWCLVQVTKTSANLIATLLITCSHVMTLTAAACARSRALFRKGLVLQIYYVGHRFAARACPRPFRVSCRLITCLTLSDPHSK